MIPSIKEMREFYHLNLNLQSPLTLQLSAMVSLRMNWHKTNLGIPYAAKNITTLSMDPNPFFRSFSASTNLRVTMPVLLLCP